jgi:putative DNA primase/helicase
MTEIARAPLSAIEATRLIENEIVNYCRGGPDKEAEHIRLGEQLNLNIEEIKGRWAKVRQEREAAETPDYTSSKPLAIGRPKAIDTPSAPRAPALFKRPLPQLGRATKPLVVVDPGPRPDARIDIHAPYEIARNFLLDRYSLGGAPTLRWWRGEWRRWTGTHYAVMEEDALRADIYEFLANANGGKFDPMQRHVNAAIDGIKARALLPTEVEPGTWLDDREVPWGSEPIISCKNGVVCLSDGQAWVHDPRLFVLNVIETEYLPNAEAPSWERFLDDLWQDDLVTRNALQELFGLALTDETKFQKGFILVGPARSGKGTIARVLRGLLGPNNFCGPSLGQLAQPFGMQGLIGKKIAVVPDARLDNRANRSVITEKLLSIIGEDVQEINRKNKSYWSGALQSRILILSNELPDFKDDTGVIATRFIILQTHRSFLGQEDTDLEHKLHSELSGILNWAIAGLQRLLARGRFDPPGSGELNDDLASIASSVKAFVAERCELGPTYTVPIEKLFMAYRAFCDRTGVNWSDRLAINQFSAKIHAAFPGVETTRPRAGNPERKRVFAGIRL